ncbi:hypothetical protein [Limimaricola litoreus]|uniref:Uncharacterized protein n=1 Tax=Limimaricola litoreus TaxID=2955316 RepID=A0A9X2FNM7_9RHOB|nr:hypothetical protein [Limimaricola litoreus]
MAERVMLDFIDSGIPILPIHDSFLVHEGHRELLHERMQVALQEVCGVEARLKAVEPDLSRVLAERAREQQLDPEGYEQPTTTDIAEIFAAQEGYDKRLDAFYALSKAATER